MMSAFFNCDGCFKIIQNSEHVISKEGKGQAGKKAEFICKV
jgi:hypothetical protein